ncbi:mucin-binding protein, partial [Streptococcus himalayensis]
MVGKNNRKVRNEQCADKRFTFSIRKFNQGVASAIIGASLFWGAQAPVSADSSTSVESDQISLTTSSSTTEDEVSKDSKTETVQSTTQSADVEETVPELSTEEVVEEKVEEKVQEKSETPIVDEKKKTENTAEVRKSVEKTTSSSKEKAENNQKPVAEKKTETAEVTSKEKVEEKSEPANRSVTIDASATTLNLETKSSLDETSTATPVLENKLATRNTEVSGARFFAAERAQTEATVSSWAEFLQAFADGNVGTIKLAGDIVAPDNASTGVRPGVLADANVTNGNSNGVDTGSIRNRPASVDRTLTLNATGHGLLIDGGNHTLDLRSFTLTPNGSDSWDITFKDVALNTANSKGALNLTHTSGQNTVTFNNVTANGSSLYGGGGDTAVVIKGNTTSTVSESYTTKTGQVQYVQKNVGTATTAAAETVHNRERREANIHDASSVTVSEGASLTISRSPSGDGINLPNGSKVEVKDAASLTINMNTTGAKDPIRYHNAGIFMPTDGQVITGKNSTLNLNTSIGQGISIGVKRPDDAITPADRFGGYGARGISKVKDSSAIISIGEGATFNFTGRDGIITGHNARFTSGEKSKVRFENQGRGVALELGDDSHIFFGKNSVNTFHSDGKGKSREFPGPSGAFDGYNYIGVDEDGTLTVDAFATFRVQMDNRGDNDWDDVISLDSRKVERKPVPLFKANEGSIVDIRDDNTNYYAELISVPLGGSKDVTFQFNNPAYVSLLRYTKSSGISAGAIEGHLPPEIPQGNNPEKIPHGNILYVSAKTKADGAKIEFNGPEGVTNGTYTVYSLNLDNKDQKTKVSSVWTNIQSGALPVAGFLPGARPEIQPSNALSDPTLSSAGSVLVNDPDYGIDPVNSNRQNIWISNGTVIAPVAQHTNTIRYVYEDGTPVLGEDGKPLVVVQKSDWTRKIEAGIDLARFLNTLEGSIVDNGDDFLAAYKKARYIVKDVNGDGIADTGWLVTGTDNTTNTYDSVASPKSAFDKDHKVKDLKGYSPSILTSNVPNIKTGADAETVTAVLTNAVITDTVTTQDENGNTIISDSYFNNYSNTGFTNNYETVVVYKKEQKARITYINVGEDGQGTTPLKTDEVKGKSGDPIKYTTTDEISNYESQGYELVSDGFPKGITYYDSINDDTTISQDYVVKLRQKVVTVPPSETPEWPEGVKEADKQQLVKDINRVVHYKFKADNRQASPDRSDKVTFERSAKVNLVTKKITYTDWTAKDGDTTFDAITSPKLAGYLADKGEVPEKTNLTENSQDIEETVYYTKLGSWVPKVPAGKEPKDPIQYPNHPTDPTKPGTPEEGIIPNIPGYTPQGPGGALTPKVPGDPTQGFNPPAIPNDPSQDTPITYEANNQKATVTFIDDTAKKNIEVKNVPGKTDQTSDYRTKPTIDKLTAQGYVLVSDNYPATGVVFDAVDDEKGASQTFEVHLKHGTQVVPPSDNPEWPNGVTDKKELVKTVTRTIHYKYADGREAAKDVTETLTFKRNATVDLVDKTVTYGDWVADNEDTTFDAVTSPTIAGYTPDKAVVAAEENITADAKNREVTVTYNAGDQKAKVTFIDTGLDGNGNTELSHEDLAGKTGAKSPYSPQATIEDYKKKGYELVSNDFPADGLTFDTVDDGTTVSQNFEVRLKPGKVTVPPTDPKDPTKPINPDYPEGPKWPAETGQDGLNKVITQTIHYKEKDSGDTLAKDATDSV